MSSGDGHVGMVAVGEEERRREEKATRRDKTMTWRKFRVVLLAAATRQRSALNDNMP